jgi:hypothetical protein
MSNLMLAGAGQPAPATTAATELAACIPVPARLPERFDGEAAAPPLAVFVFPMGRVPRGLAPSLYQG